MKRNRSSFITAMSNRKLTLAFLLTGVVAAFILLFTTPERLGPGGVTVFFGIVFLFILSLVEAYYRKFIRSKRHWPFWLKILYTSLPVVLLALSSLRQLRTLDIFAAVGLVVMINLYHNRHLE